MAYAPVSASQKLHTAWSSLPVSTRGSVKEMGVVAFATGMGLPSGLVKASRVTPVVFSVLFAAFGSNARLRNCVTIGRSVGNKFAGMGWKLLFEPGAVRFWEVRRVLFVASTWTSV